MPLTTKELTILTLTRFPSNYVIQITNWTTSGIISLQIVLPELVSKEFFFPILVQKEVFWLTLNVFLLCLAYYNLLNFLFQKSFFIHLFRLITLSQSVVSLPFC